MPLAFLTFLTRLFANENRINQSWPQAAGRQDMRNSLGNWMPQGQFKLYVPESKRERER